MHALLLAAGLGTRLRPITEKIPKCLVDINGRPLLDYWLSLLSTGDLDDVVVNLHYFPDQVRSFLAQHRHALKLRTVFEEHLLGTGGTLLANFRKTTEPVILIHADNLSLFDLHAFQQRFLTRNTPVEITMMTFDTDAPETCGIVELDTMGIVRAFHEKVPNPPGNLANGAVYIVSPAVIQFIQDLSTEVVDFSIDVLPHFIGRINTFHNDVYHRDIGNPESLRLAGLQYPLAETKQAAEVAQRGN